jgi:hypothetical protein
MWLEGDDTLIIWDLPALETQGSTTCFTALPPC